MKPSAEVENARIDVHGVHQGSSVPKSSSHVIPRAGAQNQDLRGSNECIGYLVFGVPVFDRQVGVGIEESVRQVCHVLVVIFAHSQLITPEELGALPICRSQGLHDQLVVWRPYCARRHEVDRDQHQGSTQVRALEPLERAPGGSHANETAANSTVPPNAPSRFSEYAWSGENTRMHLPVY